ncbi:hypothetical protein CDIK_1107 [Cucumispora dikerogammari]|nr:hypothetical protein CDIK_1107 [Cucumispora dikerogammari]
MSTRYKRKFITHIKVNDACNLLKITQSDILQLALLLNIKTETVKPNVTYNPLKKRQVFKNFNNRLLNTSLVKVTGIENHLTIIERQDFKKEISLNFNGNDCYNLNDLDKIYNSLEYKTLIENIKSKSEELLYASKGREIIKQYKSFDYINLILTKYKNLDEALSDLPKYLTILFLFKDIFSNKEKFEVFIKNSKEVLFNDFLAEEKLLNNLLNYFLNKIVESKFLKFVYCSSNGYFIQLNIKEKNCIFLIPGKVEIKEPTALLFYNFKYGINLLKTVLYKLYGEDVNKTLKNVDFIKSKYIFNSQHSLILHLISNVKDFNITDPVGEIVELISENKKYVHPQYLFDSFNSFNMKEMEPVNIENYRLGNEMPKQIFPFNKIKTEYSNLSVDLINTLSLKKQFEIEELKKEEEEKTFFK